MNAPRSRATSWELRDRTLTFGDGPKIMAILNVTPDSFSDGGRSLAVDDAVEHALEAVAAGADILDIGGESTRPGYTPISEKEERHRILPVVEELRRHSAVPISIDTTKAGVADAALQAGADVINDISGMAFDPNMPAIVAKHGAACILMHCPPQDTMHAPQHYPNVTQNVLAYLQERVDVARKAGIPQHRLMLDPGFGFGKNVEQNLELLRHLPDFVKTGLPILVGISRKRTIKTFTGPEHDALDHGSNTVHTYAATCGAHLLRVHNVRATKAALATWQALQPIHT